MKLLKLAVSFFAIMIFFAENSFAMTFSSPIKIGYIDSPPDGGFNIEGSTKNDGSSYQNGKFNQRWGTLYDKGIAVFGNGNDALYVHYDFSKYSSAYRKTSGDSHQDSIKKGLKFGSKNVNKTIPYTRMIWESICYIEKMNSDSDVTLYMLIYQGSVGKYEYTLLGRISDDVWVKYFDSADIGMRYLGFQKNIYGDPIAPRGGPYFSNYYCKDDSIVIEYESLHGKKGYSKEGAFQFKWDETAHWFGVAHIVY